MAKLAVKKKKNRHPIKQIPGKPLNLWVDTSSEQEVRIDIIPLVDVVFCILIFFILAAVGVSRQQAINLDLPEAKTGVAQSRELLIVVVDDLGRVFIENKPINNEEQLAQNVKTYFQTQPDGLMALYASKNATYKNVIEVLDILRKEGGNRVALATLPEGVEDPTAIQPNLTIPGVTPNPSTPNFPIDPALSPLPNAPAPVPPVPNPGQ